MSLIITCTKHILSSELALVREDCRGFQNWTSTHYGSSSLPYISLG